MLGKCSSVKYVKPRFIRPETKGFHKYIHVEVYNVSAALIITEKLSNKTYLFTSMDIVRAENGSHGALEKSSR